jgi:hypothetical protein
LYYLFFHAITPYNSGGDEKLVVMGATIRAAVMMVTFKVTIGGYVLRKFLT